MNDNSEALWNQAQAVAWVWRRDLKTVADLAQQPGAPSPTTAGAYFLGLLSGGAEHDGSFSDAKAELIAALQRGEVTAHGIAAGEDQRRAIPRVEWADMDFFDDPKMIAARRPDAARGRWESVVFLSAEVLSLWPAPKPEEFWNDRGVDQATRVGRVIAAILEEKPDARGSNADWHEWVSARLIEDISPRAFNDRYGKMIPRTARTKSPSAGVVAPPEYTRPRETKQMRADETNKKHTRLNAKDTLPGDFGTNRTM